MATTTKTRKASRKNSASKQADANAQSFSIADALNARSEFSTNEETHDVGVSVRRIARTVRNVADSLQTQAAVAAATVLGDNADASIAWANVVSDNAKIARLVARRDASLAALTAATDADTVAKLQGMTPDKVTPAMVSPMLKSPADRKILADNPGIIDAALSDD